MLQVKNLSVFVENTLIIKEISFSCKTGTILALVGHNGSGKSSLLHALMGNPIYTITGGTMMLNDVDITACSVEARARLGIFLTLQQPYEIPGVKVSTLLKESFRACHPNLSLDNYIDRLAQGCAALQFERNYLDRAVHAGFSGGEKKKLELLQAFILQPKVLLLDEIDSGLDSDARHIVGKALQILKQENPTMTVVMVTHHATLADYLKPEQVICLDRGMIVRSGATDLFYEIQTHGYR